MTVLALNPLGDRQNEPRSVLPVAMLRHWLQGRWALLFSHPGDFASYGFEADRWLVQVKEACCAAQVALLELARVRDGLHTWVADAGGTALKVRWSDVHRLSGAVRASERRLVSTVLAATTRFVLVLDESVAPRRTYAYLENACVPSPIEMACMVQRLRKQTCLESRLQRL